MDIRKTLGTCYELDLSVLPVHAQRRHPMGTALFLMGFGVVFAGFPAALLGMLAMKGEVLPLEGIITAVVFGGGGLGVFVYGLARFRWRREIRISYSEVSVTERRFRGPWSFTAVLSEYRGVVLRRQYINRRWLHIIELMHGDQDRTVLLAEYMDTLVPYGAVRARWEGYARTLNLPAIESTTEGEIVRDPSTLDRPVSAAEDAATGTTRTATTVQPSAESGPLRPPARIRVEHDIGTASYVITRNLKDSLPVFLVLTVSGVMIRVGIGMNDVSGVILATFGAFSGLYCLFGLLSLMLARQVIVAGNGKITILYRWPFGNTKGKDISMDAIESVDIDRPPARRYKCLLIKGDRMKLSAGEGLTVDALSWLRARILEAAGKV